MRNKRRPQDLERWGTYQVSDLSASRVRLAPTSQVVIAGPDVSHNLSRKHYSDAVGAFKQTSQPSRENA
jgi:hypothetical protein